MKPCQTCRRLGEGPGLPMHRVLMFPLCFTITPSSRPALSKSPEVHTSYFMDLLKVPLPNRAEGHSPDPD